MESIQLFREVPGVGLTEFPEPAGAIGYGFSYNRGTGSFAIARHDDGTMVPMADDSIIRSDDYAQVVWSDKLLNFSWSSTRPGHLQVEIV